MTRPGEAGPRYGVHCSSIVARSLFQAQLQASREGRGKAAARAFREIIRRLSHDATDFGEPVYRLPALRMQVRTVVIGPLAVDFAVCEDRPLVFIKGVKLLGKQAS